MNATAVKERPILFSGEMVRAIIAGHKTMTRRIVNGLPERIESITHLAGHDAPGEWHVVSQDAPRYVMRCRYGKPGDRLYVKEALIKKASAYQPNGGVAYAADGLFVKGGPGFIDEPDRMIGGPWPWKVKHLTGRYMPRWASRITLEVVGVRVERLQSISEADARAEGFIDVGCTRCGNREPCGCARPSPIARDSFAALWHVINGKESWEANPFVWVVSFKRVGAGK